MGKGRAEREKRTASRKCSPVIAAQEVAGNVHTGPLLRDLTVGRPIRVATVSTSSKVSEQGRSSTSTRRDAHRNQPSVYGKTSAM